MRSRVRQRKDATLAELRAHLEEQAALSLSVSTVSRSLIRLGLGRKKKSDGERNNYKRGWFRRRARNLNHRWFLFVDESAVHTPMTPRAGRAPQGARRWDTAPPNYGMQTSVIGVVGLRGVFATLTVEGAVDTLCFDAYVERVLAPSWRRGDVVVLDNLGAHRASRIEEVAARRGASVLWLPPYSPDTLAY